MNTYNETLYKWSPGWATLRRLWMSIAVFVFILLGGTIGFILIERWSPIESFYMTIITISTVGFQEVRPLSQSGRIFTAFLILIGIGTVGYGLGNLAAFFIEGELKELFRARKMEKIIEKLKDHIIICGYGEEGRHAGEELRRSRVPFVVVEKNPELVEKLQEEGLLVVHGDATEDQILMKAGVLRARGLIAAIPEDAENVFVTLTAHVFNPDLTIVARAASESTVDKLFRAGAKKVISASEIGGRRMASVLLRPNVVNFLDIIMHDEEFALRLEEVDIHRNSPFVGKSIRDLHIRELTGAMVIALHREGQPIQVNPPAESILQANDVLIVMGNDEQVEKLCELAKSPVGASLREK
ncbi:MAG: potassium channel protein [Calditrichaeota bacterium]|nr:MAG: potassium channel protein [Calditrichota bacterium]